MPARRAQEQRGRGDFGRIRHASQRDLLEIALFHLVVAGAELLRARLDYAAHPQAAHDAGLDRIHADAERPELDREAFHETDDPHLVAAYGVRNA